jgi:hypothetical protein
MSGSPDSPFAQRPARQDEPLQLPLATRRRDRGSQTVGDRA